MMAFWFSVLCQILGLFWHFRGTCCPHVDCGWIWFRWLLFWLGGVKCVSYIGRVQGLWSVRATEREMRMNLVLSQWNLTFCGL